MTDATYEALANALLDDLFDHLDKAIGDEAEVDFENGILTVELETGAQYVINKNTPTAQIWLSSPKSGAHHFAHDADSGRWASTRGGDDLLALLEKEFSITLDG